MGAYRVTFLRTLTNSYGTPFLACQRSVDIGSARTADDAIEAAKRCFEQMEGVADWALQADTFEIAVVPGRQVKIANPVN